MNKDIFMHPSAFVEKGAKIGTGTKIWHNAHVTKSAVIGKNCNIGQNCYVAGEMGEGCKLQNNVNVYQGVTLGNYVFCGPNMTFTNDLNPRAKYPKYGKWIKTKVEEGATLGAACVILCGTKVGAWSLVGAGSVVTKNIANYALVFGNPSILKGFVCECGEKMPLEFVKYSCKKCKRTYVQKNKKVYPSR